MKTKLKLPDFVASPEDLADLIMEVQDYAKWFSHNSIRKRFGAKKLHSKESPVFNPETLDMIDEWASRHDLNRQSLDRLIKELKICKNSSPTISITLAAPAPADLKKQLVDWCRNNISEEILVNFRFNSTLLGGMVVQSGSHLHDWSFRSQILGANKRLVEVLRNA